MNKTGRYISIIIVALLIPLLVTGCKKKPKEYVAQKAPITLTYYKLHEPQENLDGIFRKFTNQNPHVTMNFVEFNNEEEYLERIVSEIAEGGGPDIISVPNNWILQNYKKLTPAPATQATAAIFQELFVDIAEKDNVLTIGEESFVYGMPLTVDTLALYYNDEHFEEKIPEQGKPSSTWNGLTRDSNILTAFNADKEIQKSGLAIGSENSHSVVDALYLLLLQYDVPFYDSKFRSAKFANSSDSSRILDFLLAYSDPTSSVFSWSEGFSDDAVAAFARGDTSMILGYSDTYKKVLGELSAQKSLGHKVIKARDVKIIEAPQLDLENKVAFAHYYTEAVTRNSENAEDAWKLLTFMVGSENLQSWYDKDFKPTSRRDLIPEQRNNPIFGVFARQVGYAESFPIIDYLEYEEIFKTMIGEAQGVITKRPLLVNAQNQINRLIPSGGANPL